MNIAYYRVSTERQGRSGLGLDAQRQAVRAYLGAAPCEEYTDVESGTHSGRPQLARALLECRVKHARLIIAKLDRLSRDAAFLLAVQKSGVDFVCCDMPDANKLTIGIMALIAEHERDMISARTKAALAVARARGTRLGNPNGAAPLIEYLRSRQIHPATEAARARNAHVEHEIFQLQKSGVTTCRAIAAALNEKGILTARGKLWHPGSVQRLKEGMK